MLLFVSVYVEVCVAEGASVCAQSSLLVAAASLIPWYSFMCVCLCVFNLLFVCSSRLVDVEKQADLA